MPEFYVKDEKTIMTDNKDNLEKYRVPEDIVFGKKWFAKHQAKLLWLLNAPVIKYWFRWCLRIRSFDCSIGTDIKEIGPSYYTVDGGLRFFKKSELLKTDFQNQTLPREYRRFAKKIYLKIQKGIIEDKNILRPSHTTDFRTHDKFSKRLYYAFRPIWWTMHALDWVALDRVPELTKLSFGFTTLTQYPGSIGSDNPVDGHIINNGATYSTVRSAGTGTSTDYTDTRIWVRTGFSASVYYVYRGFILFDTSSITSGATISAAVQSFVVGVGDHQETNGGHAAVHIVSSTPASNTALATSDFGNVGSTSFASIADASIVANNSTYNDLTLDANGRANVSKTGISKFAYRVSGDLNNNTPTGTNGGEIRSSNNSGTSTDPKLVVTYTTSTAYDITLTDVVTLVDTVNKQAQKNLVDVVTIVDTVTKQSAKVLVDTVTLVDTVLKQAAKVLTDVVTLVDTVLKQGQKVLTDVVTIVDNITLAKLYYATLEEIVTLVDTVIKQTERTFTEAVTLVDTVLRQTQKVLIDAVTLVDTFFKQLSRTLTEEITLVDTINKSLSRTLTEVVTLVDTIIKMLEKTFTETVTLVDTVTKQMSKTLTDALTLVDTVVRSISREFTETITLADTFIRNLARTFVESITLNDVVLKQMQRVLTDTITVVDSFLSALFTKAKRGVTILLSRVQDKNVIQSKNKDDLIL